MPLTSPAPSASPVALLRRKGQGAGFTILEVMLAASVMALAIATSITTMQRGFADIDTARNLVIAGQLMQSEIEKMRMNSWAVVSAYPETPTEISIDPAFAGSATVGSRFRLERSAKSPQAGMMQITFTIAWRNFDGRTLRRSYMTYYSQFGLYDYFYNSST